MFIHNFKYTLLTLLKDKMLIFWTYAFPIILGTLFYMAFSDIEKKEQLDIIDIAIVENEAFQENEIWKETFASLSKKGSTNQLFSIQYGTETEAKELLEKNKITGYLLLEETPKVIVTTSGIHETILKYVTEEIQNQEITLKKVLAKKQEESLANNEDFNTWQATLYQEVITIMQDKNTNIIDTSSPHLSYTMIEFYTLIAMTCLYGGMLGMVAVNRNLANMSAHGKRVAISPVSRKSMVISSTLASYLVQLLGIFFLFIYTIFILKVDYGSHLLLIILLALVGSFAGLSLGVAIACAVRFNDNMKTGIIISITMLGCFLAGMMGISMKYIIDKNIPIINKLNPANMITDGFYSLYYYDTLTRYYLNVVSLIIFSLIMIGIAIICLRRQKYDSI